MLIQSGGIAKEPKERELFMGGSLGMYLYAGLVVAVLSSPLLAILVWIIRRNRNRGDLPKPHLHTARIRAMCGGGGISQVGNSVVCPLIPFRMLEVLGFPREQWDDIPGDFLDANHINTGPMAEFLNRLIETPVAPPEQRRELGRELVEGLCAANDQIGRPERSKVIQIWAKEVLWGEGDSAKTSTPD